MQQTIDGGLELPVGISIGHSGQPFAASIAMARRFEALGVDFVSIGDSGAETFSLLGAVAASTSRLQLISGIATWSRSPVTMAHAAKTVQNLSDGRFRLGIGPMPKLWAQAWHDLPFEPVIARMREYQRVLRACLDATAGQPTDIHGTYFSSHGFPGNPVDPERRVPIMMAATLPKMVSLAAEVADGIMLNSIHPWEWLTGPGRALIADGLDRAGRERTDCEIGIMRFCGVDDDRAVAYDNVRRSIAFYFSIPYFRALLEPLGYQDELAAGEAALRAGDQPALYAAVSDRMVEAIGIAGTPAEVLARIQEYHEHVDWMQLVGAFNGPAEATDQQSYRLAELAGRARRIAQSAAPVTNGVLLTGDVVRLGPAAVSTGDRSISRGYVGGPGRQLHYRQGGTGPVVVLLHQTASSSVMWTRVMAKFPPGYRLIAFDTPGFGSSDPLPQSPLIKDYAIRLLEALAELGISRANVVGHHTGAVIAAELAVLAPDLVVRLILMGPVVVRDDQEAQPWLDHINRWQLDARGDFVVEHLIPRLKLSVTTDDPGHMTAELVAYLQAGPDYTRAYEAVWRYRAAGRLPLILAPTLCVVGSAEMAALHEWTVAASGLVPHAQLLTVADATSEMAFEQPAEVASMIARFIGSAAE